MSEETVMGDRVCSHAVRNLEKSPGTFPHVRTTVVIPNAN
jgi:hypothetical protein